MSPAQARLHSHYVRRRSAAGITRASLALLFLLPRLLTAGAAKKPAMAAAKKPAGPTEVLTFNNGDQITGKLLNCTGTKITFDSEVAGEITVPLEKIKELKSDRRFAIVPKEPKDSRRGEQLSRELSNSRRKVSPSLHSPRRNQSLFPLPQPMSR